MFGLVRSPFADDPGRASDVFVALGALADERGADTAGLALLGAWPGRCEPRTGVVKGRGSFSRIWRPEYLPDLDRAPVVLGHTRRAAPGSPGRSDDSGRILRRLAGCGGPSEVTGVLESLAGRAALVWVDRDRPTEVHLARAALSPLTVAVDTDQNIYWASDPRWFGEAQRHTRVDFVSVVMLREGTYLKVGMERRPGRRDAPGVLATAAFKPTTAFKPNAGDGDDRVWAGLVPGPGVLCLA
ncbi:hypothetical protein GCM10022254_71050 [Actinomadura meridiana]|uniref:Uncharacterized protein n=1 Tax=Actinomadura meridiana TaxID=559626 RepID=A0ABP8CNQ2_9ACTN